MPVPSVASSVSSHSTSSVFLPSHSSVTEPTMEMPTEDLISQPVLFLLPSSHTVGTATLNSLEMHSCRGTNLSYKNAEPLLSQESSIHVDTIDCASNLLNHKCAGSSENISEDNENVKSINPAEEYPRSSDCNYINVSSHQTSISSSTSLEKAPENRDIFGKETVIEEIFVNASALPRHLQDENEPDLQKNRKIEEESVELQKPLNSFVEVANENLKSEYPRIEAVGLHENSSKSFTSLTPALDYDNCYEEKSYFSVEIDGESQVSLFENGKSSLNKNEISQSLLVQNSTHKLPQSEANISSSLDECERTLPFQGTISLSSCYVLKSSIPAKSSRSIYFIPIPDQNFCTGTSELEHVTKPVTYPNYSEGYSSASHEPFKDGVKKQKTISKHSLMISPSQQYVICDLNSEIIPPKQESGHSVCIHNSENSNINNDHLCIEHGKKLEKTLMLILAEVPAIYDHIFTFDLSKVVPECSRNLVFEKKAVFDTNSSLLNLIKVSAVGCSSIDPQGETSVISKNLSHDQVFIQIKSASDAMQKLSAWNSIFPEDSMAFLMEDKCFSCSIITLDEQNIMPKDFFLGQKPNNEPVYLGLLVPSNLLNSSTTSGFPKRYFHLGSSRPNQQYLTSTSVDMQFDGNNQDSVPFIPLGIYSPRGISDPESRWLGPIMNNYPKNVPNFDIFSMQTGVINSENLFRKPYDSSNVLLSESRCDPPLETEFLITEIQEPIVDGSLTFSEKEHLISDFEKSSPHLTLNYSSRKKEKVCEGTSASNEDFCSHDKLDIHLHLTEAMKNVSESSFNANPVYVNYKKDLVSKSESESHQEEEEASQCSGKTKPNLVHLNSLFQHSKHLKNSESFPIACWKSNIRSDGSIHSNGVLSKKVDDERYEIRSGPMPIIGDDFSMLNIKIDYKTSKSCNDLQKRGLKDQVGLEIMDSNYQCLKKKIQLKRSEGFSRQFKISKSNKNKFGIEFKKQKRNHEDDIVKLKKDGNAGFDSCLKSETRLWKLDHFGSACLSSVKNIIASTVFESNTKSSNNESDKLVERNIYTNHGLNCKTSGMFVVPHVNKYDKFSLHENSRQLLKTKSSDRKFSRNFSLSSGGSTKRSKLTILIFCLAVTSLLISLHALSTDSSLYIKPTFFLVQEDNMGSSYASENAYLSKSPLHHSEERKWESLAEAEVSLVHSVEVKEVTELGKGKEGIINKVKNWERSSKWTPRNGNVDPRVDMNKKGVIKNSNVITTSSQKMMENSEEFSAPKIPWNDFVLNQEVSMKPSISKSSPIFINAMNFSVPKSAASTRVDESNSALKDENSPDWAKTDFKDNSVNDGKNIVVSGASKLETVSREIDYPNPERNVYQSYTVNQKNIAAPLNFENQTKSSIPKNEMTASSQNEFDLNLAFIEKNELNAAYGIDSATTGADGNIEDYAQEDELGVQATSTNRVKFPKATRRLPQALIIGVRKGGTRALLEMLHLHPLVQKAAGEAHFFDRDENYAKGLQWYRRRMPPSLKGQITVEKSPSYFVTPEVPERVRAMNASIRLLLIVREPVTRAISDFAQLRSHSLAAKANATMRTKIEGGEEDYGKKPTRSLSSFESLAILPDGRVDMSWRPISVSLYHRHISAWLEAFPRDQILIVDGDQLASNPAPVLASVEKFLKLRPALTPTHFYFNATKGFYCLRSLPPGQQVGGMAMMSSSLSQSPSLPEGKCLRESKGRRHPHVDPSVVHKLRRFFAEHNRRFYEMVGEDFGWPEE